MLYHPWESFQMQSIDNIAHTVSTDLACTALVKGTFEWTPVQGTISGDTTEATLVVVEKWLTLVSQLLDQHLCPREGKWMMC